MTARFDDGHGGTAVTMLYFSGCGHTCEWAPKAVELDVARCPHCGEVSMSHWTLVYRASTVDTGRVDGDA